MSNQDALSLLAFAAGAVDADAVDVNETEMSVYWTGMRQSYDAVLLTSKTVDLVYYPEDKTYGFAVRNGGLGMVNFDVSDHELMKCVRQHKKGDSKLKKRFRQHKKGDSKLKKRFRQHKKDASLCSVCKEVKLSQQCKKCKKMKRLRYMLHTER